MKKAIVGVVMVLTAIFCLLLMTGATVTQAAVCVGIVVTFVVGSILIGEGLTR